MKKVHALTDYSKYRESDLIAEGLKIVDKSTGNPHAVGSEPTVLEVKDATKDFEDALIEAISGTRKARILKKKSRVKLETKLRAFAKWIDKVADGDLAIIAGCGLNATKPSKPRLREDLTLKRTDVPNEIIVKCRKWPKTGAYVWQYFYGKTLPTDESLWMLKTVTLQSKARLSEFAQGDILIRYCPVTKDGMQAWSEARHIFVV